MLVRRLELKIGGEFQVLILVRHGAVAESGIHPNIHCIFAAAQSFGYSQHAVELRIRGVKSDVRSVLFHQIRHPSDQVGSQRWPV